MNQERQENVKRTTVLIIVIAICSLIISGCTTKNMPTEPPDIHISIDEKSINSGWSIIKWDGTVYEKSDQLMSFIRDSKEPEIPYFEIGKSVEISFSVNPPDKLHITSTLLTEGGGQLYTDKEILNIATDYKNGNFKFEIPMHPASALSSLAVEGKKDIQGYKILASWGANECEYVFIIKTASAGTLVKATGTLMTMEDVKKLSKKGDDLSWGDFETYFGHEAGSGLYIMEYPIDNIFSVHIGGGSKEEKPMYIELISIDSNDVKRSIDIRYDDIEKFITESH